MLAKGNLYRYSVQNGEPVVLSVVSVTPYTGIVKIKTHNNLVHEIHYSDAKNMIADGLWTRVDPAPEPEEEKVKPKDG